MAQSVNVGSGSAAPALSRKEREFLRRRDEILQTAELVFSEKGFLSASMEEIAEKSEFSVGMLYRFFRSKADLYLATVENRISGLEEEIHRCLDGQPAEARTMLERYFTCRLGQYWSNPAFFKLLLQGTISLVGDPKTGFLPELERRYERLVGRLESIFASGIASGDFRSADPKLMSLSLEGLIRAYMFHLIHNQAAARRPHEERELLRLFFDGIAR